MNSFSRKVAVEKIPRIPEEGRLDITYRCNFNCRHCWLRLPASSEQKKDELTFDEIREIVEDARSMGCGKWSLSGGEPLLRPDFREIFDCITSRSRAFSINTNGSLITPKIAGMFRKKGTKMISLYGATAEIQDHITRTPGSFDATIRGLSYLKEAGAGFVVQIVPMRDNFHQIGEMKKLAESFGMKYRFGASWIYLSACGDPVKNDEIKRERLTAGELLSFDKPDIFMERHGEKASDDRLFAGCIENRRVFHIDPYGSMSFCGFLKEPRCRYDLKKGSLREGWEDFIPSLSDKIRGGGEYLDNCGSCSKRSDCYWCPVYGFLEHGRLSAPVGHLCDIAEERRKYRENAVQSRLRYYQCGGMTIRVESDLPINDTTFFSKFDDFRVDEPGDDEIAIRHHFSLPDLNGNGLGKPVYEKPPWKIYKKGESWVYVCLAKGFENDTVRHLAVFDKRHDTGRIYHSDDLFYRKGDLRSLTMLPTDQIMFAPALAYREGCIIHSGGLIMDGKGLVFAGHSDAGKSTTMTILQDRAKILCDDRNIVRKQDGRFMLYGTWSHGDVDVVSSDSAPLSAIMFLEQAKENRLIPVENGFEIVKKLLPCVVRSLETNELWDRTLKVLKAISREVPCYVLRFDKSGGMKKIIEEELINSQ